MESEEAEQLIEDFYIIVISFSLMLLTLIFIVILI